MTTEELIPDREPDWSIQPSLRTLEEYAGLVESIAEDLDYVPEPMSQEEEEDPESTDWRTDEALDWIRDHAEYVLEDCDSLQVWL